MRWVKALLSFILQVVLFQEEPNGCYCGCGRGKKTSSIDPYVNPGFIIDFFAGHAKRTRIGGVNQSLYLFSFPLTNLLKHLTISLHHGQLKNGSIVRVLSVFFVNKA